MNETGRHPRSSSPRKSSPGHIGCTASILPLSYPFTCWSVHQLWSLWLSGPIYTNGNLLTHAPRSCLLLYWGNKALKQCSKHGATQWYPFRLATWSESRYILYNNTIMASAHFLSIVWLSLGACSALPPSEIFFKSVFKSPFFKVKSPKFSKHLTFPVFFIPEYLPKNQ